MASSGSSGRGGGAGSKGFDFASDDVLCSYDDFGNQETSNGKHCDPVIKDFRESRMGRSAFLPVYNQQDESLGQEVIATVEKTMKKYADNLLRFLEGISARLSQLELYCYNLEKSIGEMRSDLNHQNSEADANIRTLEKHLQEVHRSIQILRDKQELADTQKELAKLQLHKESSTVNQSQHKEEGVMTSASDIKKLDSTPEVQNQQLALALPHQVNPTSSLPARSMEQHQHMPPSSQNPPPNVHGQTQPRTYYPQQPTPPLPTHHNPQDQYIQADSQYQRAQLQVPQSTPQPLQSHVVQPPQVPSFSSYQQQWPQQYSQQGVQQSQQPQAQSQQTQGTPQTPSVYSPYPPTQPINASPETFSSTALVQVPFPGIPQSGVSRSEPVGYGYGGSGTPRPAVQQQPPPQHHMQPQPQPQPQSQPQTHQNTYGSPLSDGAYSVAGPQPPQTPSRQGYAIYDGESGRVPPTMPPNFPQGGYPPSHVSSLQNPPPPPARQSNSSQQMMRPHPYSEMAEKAINMGYPRDYVLSVMRRMEESGQPMDYNTLLDRLNMQSSGGPQRPW